METGKLRDDIDFLRRRQRWLEDRIKGGKDLSYDVKEAKCLGRVLDLLESAIKRAEGMV